MLRREKTNENKKTPQLIQINFSEFNIRVCQNKVLFKD